MKLLGMAVLPLFLIGCADKTVYVDRPVEVKIPVPCKIKEVERAKVGVNSASTLADELRELKELREAAKQCQ